MSRAPRGAGHAAGGVDEALLAGTIARLLARRTPAASICPSEVARALAHDEAAWRALMPRVRTVAARLRAAGQLRITRGGQDVAPGDEQRGAIRLARGPRFDEDAGAPPDPTP